jgi:hypothetical protein
MNEEENPIINEEVLGEESELKQLIVDYVGSQLDPESDEVTAGMIVEVFAKEFPELLLLIAEENFIRGYHQAFADIEAHENAETDETDEPTD